MGTYFENMTDKQVRDWYYAFAKSYTKKHPLPTPTEKYIISGQRHDIFNVYAYGDVIKVVYIKRGRNIAPPKENAVLLPEKRPPTEKKKTESFSQSVSRAKSRIFELSMCNEFTHFCTFTQDKEKRDRFNLAEFRKDFAQFVRNQNRFRPEARKIKYLLIPEQHKNGAWHMHGLLMGLGENDLKAFSLKDHIPKRIKEQIKNGEAVYDWLKYRKSFGYFTCTEIKDKSACSKYVTKYISKDLQKTIHESGEHLFFASQGLKGRETILKNCAEQCPFTEWDFENEYVKIAEIKV
jgi:hypothetical protein